MFDMMEKSPKNEFIELIAEINRLKGLDELTSKIIGILFIEPEVVSLDELAKRTGYSLSAVSTAMKLLVGSCLIKRSKKPKSKKVYFYIEKDMISLFMQTLNIIENNTSMLKKRVPGIIERYKLEKSEDSKAELKIIENYYEQVLITDRIMRKMIEMFENVQAKRGMET